MEIQEYLKIQQQAFFESKGLAQLPGDGDQIIIEGVGGKYEITDSTAF